MRAMVMTGAREPLELREVPVPDPGPGEVLVKVHACGVCRTDLHVLDGDLHPPKDRLVPGHEIAGTVVSRGAGAHRFREGDRVGVPWLGRTCGACAYCLKGSENLCENPWFTGYTIDGGYAEYAAADERFCFPLPPGYSFTEAAPLLCAGLIGYRSYVMTGGAGRIGIYGFGAAAHIVTQVAVHQGREVYAFTRPGDRAGQEFALGLGASWAGDSNASPPRELDAAIIFAPVGSLVPLALGAVAKGGTVVCAGIHMSPIPQFPYEILWGERVLRSVANLTRRDGEEFLAIAPEVPVRVAATTFPLALANDALSSLREGKLSGCAVLEISGPRVSG